MEIFEFVVWHPSLNVFMCLFVSLLSATLFRDIAYVMYSSRRPVIVCCPGDQNKDTPQRPERNWMIDREISQWLSRLCPTDQSALTMSGNLFTGSMMAASSVRWLKKLFIFVLICPLCVPAFLNIEELTEMKYGIQILPDPVILGQVSELLLTSLLARMFASCRWINAVNNNISMQVFISLRNLFLTYLFI